MASTEAIRRISASAEYRRLPSDEQKMALLADEGITMKDIGTFFSLSSTAVWRKVKRVREIGNLPVRGTKRALTDEEEEELATFCRRSYAERNCVSPTSVLVKGDAKYKRDFFPLFFTQYFFLIISSSYLTLHSEANEIRINRRTEKRLELSAEPLTRGYIARFLDRKGLKSVNSRKVDTKRSEHTTVERISGFFDAYEAILHKNQPPPELIVNVDETQLEMVNGTTRVIVPSEVTHGVSKADEKAPQHITLVIATTAAGTALQPLAILPLKHLSPGLKNFQDKHPEWLICGQDSGWITTPIWRQWIQKVLGNYLLKEKQKLQTESRAILLSDGHLTRRDFEATKALDDMGTDLILFVPHTTHICQPNDRGAERLPIHFLNQLFPKVFLELSSRK